MANLVKFATGSSENYKTLTTKDDNTLYFLNDTLQLYKGSEIYCKSYKIVDFLPATGVENTLYIVKSTKKLQTWNGSAWVEALDAFYETTNKIQAGTDTGLVTAGAVFTYVASEISKLTGGVTDAFVTSITTGDTRGLLQVHNGEKTTNVNVKLDGLALAPIYDPTTRKFTFPQVGGDALEVNLGKDLVVTNGEYDEITKSIILTIGDTADNKTVTIPVGDLVDTYTASADTTGAVQINITNNEIKGTVIADNTTIKIVDGKLAADFSNLVTSTVFENLVTRVETLETWKGTVNTAIGGLQTDLSNAESKIATIEGSYVSKTFLSTNNYTKTEIDGKITTINTDIGKVQTALDNALTWNAIG